MSKNIVIQEGGVGRQFTADKLTTALVGGGSCNWVPEDEIQLGTKFITENGTYIAANDGEYGYSQVTVNVSSAEKIITGTTDSGEPVVTTIDVVDGTISEIILGDYFIVTYDEDGKVAKIEDNNGNVCTLIYDGETLSGFDDIEDNHYTIILDSNGNISQVIDPNAQNCELRDSDNDGKIDIISVGAVLEVVPDIETGEIKIIDENDNDVTDDYIGTSITGVDDSDTSWRANITDSTSGGGASIGVTPVAPATTVGSSITGIDADGDKTVVKVDEDGKITSQKVPSSIVITSQPSKLIYNNGEAMDYTGMVVTAKLASGDVFEDETYPNGIIPISELELPNTASISEGDDKEWADGEINALRITYSAYNGYFNYYPGVLGMKNGYDITLGGGNGFASLFLTRYNGKTYAARETGDNPSYDLLTYPELYIAGGTSSQTILGVFIEMPWSEFLTNVPESTVNPSGRSIGNLRPIKHHVPVKWQSPYDFVTLETSFEITVNPT